MASKEKKAAKKAALQAAARKKKITRICLIAAAVLVIAGVIVVPKLLKKPVYADIAIKDYGTVTVRLEPQKAPITCENFISLAEGGFYDGLTFHRIISGFMMQGGDPNGNGTGGSGREIKGEFTSNGVNNDLSHTRGAVSMARSTDPDSASSQFFIVHKDSPHLDGDYAVFGYVTAGMDIVDAICAAARPVDNNGTIPRTEQPVISSVLIRYGDA